MKFKKVTRDESQAYYSVVDRKHIECTGEAWEMPTRSTEGSAGYDFHSPYDVTIKPGKSVRFPLLVRVTDMPKDMVLLVFNRSGMSLTGGIRLDNAVGVIDSDYTRSIWFQATNHGKKTYRIKTNDKVLQGVFVKFEKVDNDNASGERNGGLGSTGK